MIGEFKGSGIVTHQEDIYSSELFSQKRSMSVSGLTVPPRVGLGLLISITARDKKEGRNESDLTIVKNEQYQVMVHWEDIT